MAVNIPNVIQQARQAGIPDQVTLQHLQDRGLVDAQGQPIQQSQSGPGPIPVMGATGGPSDAAKVVGNIPASTANFAAGMVTSPVQTLTQIPDAVSGLNSDYAAAQQSVQGEQDQQQRLLQTIAQEKAQGKDTSRLESFYHEYYGNGGTQLPSEAALVAGSVPKAAYESVVPQAARQAISGDTIGAEKTLVEDPVGQILPFLLAGREAAYKAGVGEAFDGAVGKVASPVTGPMSSAADAVASAGARAADAVTKTELPVSDKFASKYSPADVQAAKEYATALDGNTPGEKFNTANDVIPAFEDTYQGALKNDYADISVPTSSVVSDLRDIVNSDEFKNDLKNHSSIRSQVASTINALKEYGPDIQVADLNAMKRSYWEPAYGSGGTPVSPLDKAIGEVLRQHIEDAVSNAPEEKLIAIPPELEKFFGDKKEVSVKDFNTEYGKLLRARKLLKGVQSKGMETNPHVANIMRRGAKTLGATVGGVIGHAIPGVGTIVGGYVGEHIAAAGEKAAESPTGRAVIGGTIKNTTSAPSSAMNAKVPRLTKP